MELKVVRYDVSDGVALVTLDRAARMNAWTGRMHTEYRWVMAEAERNDAVRAIVVTGAGRAFCAGADTTALDGHVDRGSYDAGVDQATLARPGFGIRPEFDHAFAFHYGIPKIVIAAINGPAAGVGLVLACYCDVRYVAAGAKLTTSSGRLGLPAEYGLSWVLPRLVGIGPAADLLLSSRVILAEEAERIGLVNRVLAPDAVLGAALDYARTIAHEISPSSVRESKRQLYTDLHRDVGSAVAESETLLDRMATEPDFREGVRAWQEKRPPAF